MNLNTNTQNIFENPLHYLDILKSKPLIKVDMQERHDGKSLAVIFLTRYCKVGCTHCIYHSKPKFRNNIQVKEKDEFTHEGIKNTVQFINSANVEYLLIAGGGEPFEKEEHIYHLVEHCNVNRVVIATAGYFGRNYEKACKVLENFKEILDNRENKLTLVLRISADQWHTSRIGNKMIINIIKAFDELIGERNDFILELHTIENDKSIDEIQLLLPISKRMEFNNIVSDNDKIQKNSKKRGVLTLASGLNIPIGYAKLFNPNLLVDLNCTDEKLKLLTKPYYEDNFLNQKGNYSIVYNDDGTKGLDYIFNFNGNVTTWGNYQLNNISNIYMDSYQDVINNLYNDVISYSFINHNLEHREYLVNLVNPNAVKRSAAINIRDYSGAYMLQENHTALFYSICLIKQFIAKGIVDTSVIKGYPEILIDVINKDIKDIVKIYKQANYSIIQQYIDDINCTKDDWIYLLKLIQLNHYCVSENQLKQGVQYFNNKYNTNYHEIIDITKNIDIVGAIPRLIERMTFQPERVSRYLAMNTDEKVLF